MILGLLLMLTANAEVNWESYLAQKAAQVSHPRHLPYQLTHGHRTPVSVLVVHGIYSSPLYFRGISEEFFRKGYNVVTVLLPGHWDKDLYSINRVKSEDWSREAALGLELALQLGDKVIMAGHSLGALLSVEQAILHPSRVKGLFLISPAVKVKDTVVWAAAAGECLNLSGNTFTRSRPDGVQIPFFGPAAASVIQQTARRILVKRPTVPVFMAYTKNDNVLDVGKLTEFYQRLTGPKEYRLYGRWGRVHHGNIAQSPRDFTTNPNNDFNPDFDPMMEEGMGFLNSL